jgi:hypothetical protein
VAFILTNPLYSSQIGTFAERSALRSKSPNLRGFATGLGTNLWLVPNRPEPIGIYDFWVIFDLPLAPPERTSSEL